MSTNDLLSISQVRQIEPGTKESPAWISPGFFGVCRNIELRSYGTPPKKMWPCTFADSLNEESIEVTFFTVPKFKVGDEVHFSGKGLRRTEFNGNAQASIGKDTVVEVRASKQQTSNAAHAAIAERENGAMINGQACGNALSNTWELARYVYRPDELKQAVNTPEFWRWFHQVCSDHLRTGQLLEAGKLADPVKVRMGQTSRPPPPQHSTVEEELGAEAEVPF